MGAHAHASALGAALLLAASLLVPGAALAQGVPAVPIPEQPHDEPTFLGKRAQPNPVAAPSVPEHPFMAPNGNSNLHVDAYASDVNERAGPLGRRMDRVTNGQFGECASLTFDSEGRLVTICVGLEGPRLELLDAETLNELAFFPLPPRQPGTDNPFTQFGGGGYFYLDDRDRAVIPTTDRHILIVGQTSGPTGPGFAEEEDFDLNGVLAGDDVIVSALPDFAGNIWFVSQAGVVGFVEPDGPDKGTVHSTALDGEGITNSFAIDESGGVYIVSDRALYRFDVDPSGEPEESWREDYDNTLVQKPGHVDDGSGTTPTLMGDDLVAITDNDDPMKVVVLKRGKAVPGERVVCEQPVFEAGASATDNSLIATEDAIVVENNHGYEGPDTTTGGRTTTPGVERVDLDADGQGCSRTWSSEVASPTVVPKLSLANGLVYVYEKKAETNDPWYLTAIDFRTGETVYQRLSGIGLGFNNNYAPITLGPDGAAYIGVLDGLVRLSDSVRKRDPGDDDDGDDGDDEGNGDGDDEGNGDGDGKGDDDGGEGGEGRPDDGGGRDGGGADREVDVAAALGGGSGGGGALPFTGLGLGALALLAAGALGGGLALRRLAGR